MVSLGALVLAGCSSDDEKAGKSPSQESSPSASPRTSGSLVQTWPLTGRRAEQGLPKRPVTVVKVDNTSNARPQVGLDKADLVVEELVEGGMTRLAAFYHSRTPRHVGPVRSMRDSDIGIVQPAHGVLVASGGASSTVRRLKKANVKMFSETNGNIDLDADSSRTAPYNRIIDLKSFQKRLHGVHRLPEKPYLGFGKVARGAGKRAPKRLQVTFSPAHQTTWKYGGGAWRRQNGETASASAEFPADNLLVLSVRVTDAGYRDPAGSKVPKTVFKGKGDAVLFDGRRKVTGTWSKSSMSSTLRLTTESGQRIPVPAGRTFVELIPKDGGSIG